MLRSSTLLERLCDGTCTIDSPPYSLSNKANHDARRFHIVEWCMSDIQSVKRAFDILKAVSSNGGTLSLSDIAARVELPKSTVSRMLTTLESVGAVQRVNPREGFSLGDELLALTAQVPYPRSMSAIARPYLQALSRTTGETLTLCVPDGDYAHYIDQIDSEHALQIHDWCGQRLPLHAASDGKIYLAERTDAQIGRYIGKPLHRFTRNTLISVISLKREMKIIRKNGYAWTNGEFDSDIVGVAAPIRDESGSVVGSVCLFGPAFRWPKERDAQHFIQATKDTANKISIRLGNPAMKPGKPMKMQGGIET